MRPVASLNAPDVAVMVPVPLTTGVKVVEVVPTVGARLPATIPVPPHMAVWGPRRLLLPSYPTAYAVNVL